MKALRSLRDEGAPRILGRSAQRLTQHARSAFICAERLNMRGAPSYARSAFIPKGAERLHMRGAPSYARSAFIPKGAERPHKLT